VRPRRTTPTLLFCFPLAPPPPPLSGNIIVMLLLLFAAAKNINFINFLCRLSLFSQKRKEKKRKERVEGLLFGEDDAKTAFIFFWFEGAFLRERGQKPLFSPAKRIKRKTVANSTSLL